MQMSVERLPAFQLKLEKAHKWDLLKILIQQVLAINQEYLKPHAWMKIVGKKGNRQNSYPIKSAYELERNREFT